MFDPMVGVDTALSVMQPILNSVSVVDPVFISDPLEPMKPLGTESSGGGIQSIFNFIGKMLRYFLAFVIAAGILGLMVVGLMYITSRGDSRQMGQAKTYAFAIAVGLAIAVGAYYLVGVFVSEVDTTLGDESQKIQITDSQIGDESYKDLINRLNQGSGKSGS